MRRWVPTPPSMMPTIEGYHAHVYFTPETRDSALRLRDDLAAAGFEGVRVSGLREVPVGPHALPMFEVQIHNGSLETALRWLMLHHGQHSVLVHPLTGDDVRDHREFPMWLGTPLPIDFSRL